MSNINSIYNSKSETVLKSKIGQAPLTLLLVILFLFLRFVMGGREAVEEANLAVVVLGLAILTGLIMINRPIALVLIVFDITDMAGLVNPLALGIRNLFKFKDLEFLILMAVGFIGFLTNPHLLKIRRKTPLLRVITIFITIIGIYIIYTLTFQNVSITFRISRHLIYYAVFFVIPFYITSEKEFYIAVKGFLVVMLVSSITHILQTLFFQMQTLLPYTQSRNLPEGVVRLWGPTQPLNFIGIFVLFGYLIQMKKNTFLLNMVFGICLLAVVLTFARTYVAYIIVGLFFILLLLSPKMVRRRNMVRYFSAIFISFLFIGLLLMTVGKENLVLDAINGRIDDAQVQFRSGTGTFFGHIEYAFVASSVIIHNGGNVLTGLGFRGLSFSQILTGGSSEEQLYPTFNSDNGWAGIFISMGFVGVLLFFYLLITGAKYCYRVSKNMKYESVRMLSTALFSFFVLSWIYWFFSALGIWQDSSIVIAVALGFLEQAVGFEKSRINK